MTKKELLKLLEDFKDETELKCSCFDSGANQRLVLTFNDKDVFIDKGKTSVEIVLWYHYELNRYIKRFICLKSIILFILIQN